MTLSADGYLRDITPLGDGFGLDGFYWVISKDDKRVNGGLSDTWGAAWLAAEYAVGVATGWRMADEWRPPTEWPDIPDPDDDGCWHD